MCGKRQIIVLVVFICLVMFLGLVHTAKAAEEHNTKTTERLVSIYDRGVEQTIVTNARTVRQALEAADISIGNKDVVEPDIDMALSGTKYQVNIHRAKLVVVVDGVVSRQIMTAEKTPLRIARAAGVKLYTEDKIVFSSPDNLLVSGASLVMKIDRAKQRTVTEEIEIDFDVEQTRDFNHPIGYKEIKQLGEKGVRRVTYQVQAKNGVEVSRREVSGAVTKNPKKQVEIIGAKPLNPLTKSKGAHIFTDSKGVSHRETYYDLPMNVVISACGGGGYKVREDGAKVDKDGYILVAANYGNYPRCSVVETSMGPGKVYDTGGFAAVHPHGFDLATDWTKADGI